MDGRVAPVRTRRRPALSCVQCRRRKIRCDRNKPCGQCTQFKIPATCIYGLDNPSNDVLRRTELTNSSSASTSEGLFEIGPQTTSTRSDIEDSEAPTDKLHQLSDAASRLQNDSTNLLPVAEKSSRMRGVLSKTRFFGQSHWMVLIEEEFNIMEYFKKKLKYTPESMPEDDEGLQWIRLVEMCKSMARVTKAVRPTQPFLLPDLQNSIPSREMSDQLVDSYLRTCESTFRILHIPTLYLEYYRYWNEPQTATAGFVVKLLLVMAIGTCYYQGAYDDGKDLRSLARQWVYEAQRWLSATSEKSKLNITGLQINCLVLLARETTGLDDDLIWISAGSVLRMAFNMGLHRDPKYFSSRMSVFSSELRRRLWATVLEMAVQASLDAGMPPLISLHDFDCGPPSNIDDIEIEEATKTYPASKPSTSFTQTSIQIALLKSMRTRLEIVRLLNDFRADPSYDEVLRLGADITQACRENNLMMQSHLSSSTTRHGVHPTELNKNLLDLYTRRFLLLLHRPFAIKAKADPRFYFSRKVCLESAMIFTSYIGDLAPLSHIQDDFTRLAVMGGGSVDEAILHDAAMSICFELVTQLEDETSNNPSNDPIAQPSIINQLSRSTREPLIRAVRHAIELAEYRMTVGETNVKGHLFLSAVLGQISAMGNGIAPEKAILKAVKESAEKCYELLLARTTLIPDHSETQVFSDKQSSLDAEMQQNLDMMMDPSISFDMQDSWFFSDWNENGSGMM